MWRRGDMEKRGCGEEGREGKGRAGLGEVERGGKKYNIICIYIYIYI
jgi:hypothetical protein